MACKTSPEKLGFSAGIGDLERSIARLCASSLGAFGRDNTAVVLYEDAAKRKVSAFLSVLKGLEKLQARIAGKTALLSIDWYWPMQENKVHSFPPALNLPDLN